MRRRVAVGHREHDLHAGRRAAGDRFGHVEAGVEHAIAGYEPPEPPRVPKASIAPREEHDLAVHPGRGVEGVHREVELVHLAADRRHEQPQGDVGGERRLRPHVHAIARRVLVEASHGRVDRGALHSVPLHGRAQSRYVQVSAPSKRRTRTPSRIDGSISLALTPMRSCCAGSRPIQCVVQPQTLQ